MGLKGTTCMFHADFIAEQINWVQLGWLAAWAYHHHDTHCHERSEEHLPTEVQQDAFLMTAP